MGLFILDKQEKINKTLNQLWINARKTKFKKTLNLVKFSTGDIITVRYWNGFEINSFEGICICVRRKQFVNLDSTVILRNVLMGIGIEVTISYFYNRILASRISDYKRKKFVYWRAKLYELRCKLNRASRVK